ncbi:MAG: hypothetical protein KU29_00630 [Sulfurovum sp. FS06-10]|jgi:DNA polymerase-3 subunit delta'|nr:MAG: hypothetical protein KU29_00630 [Sulfurovum sp. FS06-10]
MRLASGIIVTHKPQAMVAQLKLLKTTELFTFIDTEAKEFLVEHAQEAISKAYIASEELNYIILIAPRFSVIAQNRLLKILEEPPRNKAFILITESKSSLLDTIQSRLPVTVLNDAQSEEQFDLDIANLNLAKVYTFIQAHSRASVLEAKEMVEKISLQAIKSQKYNLDESTLKLFSDAIKALEVGSPTIFILNTVLLKLLARKR